MINEIKMEITRNGESLSSVKVIMPTWNKVRDNGLTYISLPFFGLETCAKNDDDAAVALSEAVQCFCLIAERHGLGLESELEFVGWEKSEEKGDTEFGHSFMNVTPKNEAFDNIINTGETQALQLTLA